MILVVCDVPVSMNKDGLYSLNDFHKAAGGEEKDKPANWLRLDKTKELIQEYAGCSEMSITISVVKGGKNQGTFVCEELVYAYAAWISPKFYKLVLDTFKNTVHAEQQRKVYRELARDGYKDLTKALKYSFEGIGKIPKFYHYSNEADMINRIVLGMTAKQFRTEHGLNDDDQIRDHQTPFQIFAIEQLQRMDDQLINLGFTVEQRRNALQKRFDELSIRAIGLSG